MVNSADEVCVLGMCLLLSIITVRVEIRSVNVVTADRLAQLVEHRTTVREVTRELKQRRRR